MRDRGPHEPEPGVSGSIPCPGNDHLGAPPPWRFSALTRCVVLRFGVPLVSFTRTQDTNIRTSSHTEPI